MQDLFRFLQVYEIWIYILLGLIALVYGQKLIGSWQEWRAAIFGMEKENAQRKMSASIAILGLVFIFAAAEFVLVSFVFPVLPQSSALLTPTLDLLATPTITLPPGMAAPAGTAEPALNAQSAAQPGCIPGQVEWTSPVSGEEVNGQVELKGTVNITDLAFYKYDYSQPGSDTWLTLAGGNTPKNDELIGTWNTEQLIPGDYRLRLVVYNTQNQEIASCELNIVILAPPQ